MPDPKYCYPDSNVLINKLNIRNHAELFESEKRITFARLQQLQSNPLPGKYDFQHLKDIHRFIFQDIYAWAGQERTVEIGKGNLFCTTAYLQDYARSVFAKYFPECFAVRHNHTDFVRVLSENYGDLNALHPFREGNGRAQREFARLVCLRCGYVFDLSCSTHSEMLAASKLSFDKGDSTGFISVFSRAVLPYNGEAGLLSSNRLNILTRDDLTIPAFGGYDYYESGEHIASESYDKIYKAKILKMDAEMQINEAKEEIETIENEERCYQGLSL